MHSARSIVVAAGMFALALLLTFAIGSSAALADTAGTAAAVESNVTTFMGQQLNSYQGSDGPFQSGVWTDASDTCWACDNGGPATAAATQYVLTGASNPVLFNDAKQTIYTAIADDQSANGSFNPPNTTPNVDNSIWFGDELGTTYRLLYPYLSAQARTAWQTSLAADANYLINAGETTWYINGNINLAETELLWLTWQATGNQTFETAYNNSWTFIMNPGTKFPGAGWVTVTAPTQADGSDGQGYFPEIGAGSGWDPYYSTLQLDVAARLYLLSGDPRALQVTNMIMNLESPLINTSNWMLNSSGGTRHTGPNTSELITSAYAVLGLEGGRTDLQADILPQIQQEEQWYTQPGQADLAGFRRAFGNSVSVIALAAALADPATSAAVSQYSLIATNTPTPTPTTTSATGATTAPTATPATSTPTITKSATPTTPTTTTTPTRTAIPTPTPTPTKTATPTTSSKAKVDQQLVEDLHDADFYGRNAEDLGHNVAPAHATNARDLKGKKSGIRRVRHGRSKP